MTTATSALTLKHLEGFSQSIPQDGGVVLADHVCPATATHLMEPGRVPEHVECTFRQLARVEPGQDPATPRVAHQLLWASAGGHECRDPAGEGLGDHDAEPFLQRRKDEEARASEGLRD